MPFEDLETTPLVAAEIPPKAESPASRRKVMAAAFLLFAGSTAFAYSRGEAEGRAEESALDVVPSSPHIVFFLIDDLGYNDIGYNSVDLPDASPFMTSMAEDGVRLGSYYSMLECTPARAALMTGRYPVRTGMQHQCIQANEAWGLSTNEVLLPEYLATYGGYRAHMVGKWDLGHFAPALWPQSRGFESFVGLTCYGYVDYSAHLNSFWGETVSDLHDGFTALTEDTTTYSTFKFGDAAADVVAAHDPVRNYQQETAIFIPKVFFF